MHSLEEIPFSLSSCQAPAPFSAGFSPPHTKANTKSLWTIQQDEVAAVASDLRGDL